MALRQKIQKRMERNSPFCSGFLVPTITIHVGPFNGLEDIVYSNKTDYLFCNNGKFPCWRNCDCTPKTVFPLANTIKYVLFLLPKHSSPLEFSMPAYYET